MAKKIAIFGSGLSAAFVYAACEEYKCDVKFFSDTLERPNIGPVLIRQLPIRFQGLVPATTIWTFAMGDKNTYLDRMRRDDEAMRPTSFPTEIRDWFYAYEPKAVYDTLMGGSAKLTDIGKYSDAEIKMLSREFHHTFVTFPLQESKHPSKLIFYWAYIYKHEAGGIGPFTVLYNGTRDFPWLRYSHYWGTECWDFSNTEFPTATHKPPAPSVSAVLNRVADIAPGTSEYHTTIPKVTLVGRWARWKKSVFAHHAYTQAMEILKEMHND